MSYTSPCTGINSIKEKNKNKKRRTRNSNKNNSNNKIEIGTFRLPGGLVGRYIFSDICKYLDIRSLLNFMETSLIKQLIKECGSDNFKEIINDIKQPVKRLYLLNESYRREFPEGTPIVCACQRGRMDDVELFVTLHPYHKYITNRDVNGYRVDMRLKYMVNQLHQYIINRDENDYKDYYKLYKMARKLRFTITNSDDDMTLKEYVNQVGTNSDGNEYTPLIAAAAWEHFQVVQYLIEQGEADPNAEINDGLNALYFAANYNRTNTELIQLLLTHMTLDSINWNSYIEDTPLDFAYFNNDSPIKQEIIALLRSKGVKANRHDENGNEIVSSGSESDSGSDSGSSDSETDYDTDDSDDDLND